MVWEMRREGKPLRKNNDKSRKIVFFEQFVVGTFLIFNYCNFAMRTFSKIDYIKKFSSTGLSAVSEGKAGGTG